MTAVNGVSFDVRPGKIRGLKRPNGAGGTMDIDATTAFVRRFRGIVSIGDRDITDWLPRRRAVAGLERSFQSLELFDDLTTGENLMLTSGLRDEIWKDQRVLEAYFGEAKDDEAIAGAVFRSVLN
jgi:sulfate-transporting ATPase